MISIFQLSLTELNHLSLRRQPNGEYEDRLFVLQQLRVLLLLDSSDTILSISSQ